MNATVTARSLRGRWAVLCDGDVVASFAAESDARGIAYHYALADEPPAVALCRLGPAASRTLRRFEDGREVTT